jgi:hypothetical protein
MEKHPICISRTIKFSERLIGIPCVKSLERPTPSQPFYACNKKIDLKYIKKHGVCDAGLFNILRRFNKLPIPGSGKRDFYPEGSMESWIYVFKKSLKKFYPNKNYPKGTLLFAKNKLAMIVNKNIILHCCDKEGIVLKNKIEQDFILVCFPKNWILLE